MATTPRSKKAKGTAWWVQADDTCHACSQGFAHRTEFYCIDCDSPVCPICIQRITTVEMVCPDCFTARARDGGDEP